MHRSPIAIMNKTAIVWTFVACAGALAAQVPQEKQKPKPSEEIAGIVAVEEQERDLAKAEKLYREALAGKTLSVQARELATTRLAELLMRLGRRDDAKQVMATAVGDKGTVVTLDDITGQAEQDRAREAALREKARELVRKAIEGPGQQSVSQLFGINGPTAEQLLWIGEPAVPEVIAYLETIPEADRFIADTVSGLAAFVWRTGGAKAAAFMRQAKEQEKLRPLVSRAACAATAPEMIAVAVEYLKLPDPELAVAVLDSSSWGRPLGTRLDASLLIDVMGKGSVPQRLWLLGWSARINFDTSVMPQLLDVVRAALTSTEPALGAAAQQFLVNDRFKNDKDVIELLLEWLPSPLLGGRSPSTPNERLALDVERAQRWMAKIDTCVQALGPYRNEPRFHWLSSIAWATNEVLGAEAVPRMLRWVDLGYPFGQGFQGKITPANAAEVWSRFDRISDPNDRGPFLAAFGEIDLPPSLFPAMRAKADEFVRKAPGWGSSFVLPMARTGNPDAAAWILAAWQRQPDNCDGPGALVVLGRRSQHEAVRAAMRTMAIALKPKPAPRLYLALLSMHDTEALAQMTKDVSMQVAARHPYANLEKERELTPLAYVLQDQPDPPHGFTEPELMAFAQTVSAWEGTVQGDSRALLIQPRRVPTNLVLALAERSQRNWLRVPANQVSGFRWVAIAAERIAAEEAMDGPLHRWMLGHLQHPGHATFAVEHLGERDVRHLRPQLDALIAGDDAAFAGLAFRVLLGRSEPLDFEALTRSKHEEVARSALDQAMNRGVLSIPAALQALGAWPDDRDSIARYCGAKVAVEAVPALLKLLQDPEPHVRERAAEALTRIRFFHEQQAHWERVTKGLDASPASAVEKLLLQSKPGAPKEQRLLAIPSLGTLGVPEALPFLIEWTTDADAAIAKAAKDAITQIHLNPRR